MRVVANAVYHAQLAVQPVFVHLPAPARDPDNRSVHRKRKAFDDAAGPEAMGPTVGMPEAEGALAKAPTSRVKEKHSATEKRRRDRIAEGYAAVP